MLLPFLLGGKMETGCFSLVANLKCFLTKLWDADQLTMLEKAWTCLNATEHYHGIVAVNVNCDVADQILGRRETLADVRLTLQINDDGKDTGVPQAPPLVLASFRGVVRRLSQSIASPAARYPQGQFLCCSCTCHASLVAPCCRLMPCVSLAMSKSFRSPFLFSELMVEQDGGLHLQTRGLSLGRLTQLSHMKPWSRRQRRPS